MSTINASFGEVSLLLLNNVYGMPDRASRPNVLCFVVDQMRYDQLGCTGNETISTPHIDTLANDGVIFDRNYVTHPACMPARGTLFSGRPPRDGVVRANGTQLPDDVETVPELLGDVGYSTHATGKIHFGSYSLPFEQIAYMIEQGEISLDDYPERYKRALRRVIEETDESGFADTEIDPEQYPESKEMWKTGRITEPVEPYYGFDTVDLTCGHTDGVFGEYENWLRENHPEEYARFHRSHPDNELRATAQSFDWAFPEELHYNRWIADRTRDRIRDAAADDDPFFMLCSFPDPHHPWGAPEPWGSMYDPEEVEMPVRRDGELNDLPPFYRDVHEDPETELNGIHRDSKSLVGEPEIRDLIAVSYGMVSFVDAEVGRVMETVADLGLREDTVVVFLSDHGDMMGDHWMAKKGPFQFEGLLRVPMIWSWPGEIPDGERTSGLTSQLDFAPTVLDYCDVPTPDERRRSGSGNPYRRGLEPDQWPGESLRRQIAGETDSIHDGVIVENDEDYLGLRIRTYITDRYKLTVYPGREYGELFDLKNDPDELHNRWDDPEYEGVKNQLYREMLEQYILEEGATPSRESHS